MSSKATESVDTTFVAGYTVALFVFAVVAGTVAWIEIALIGELEAESETLWATVLRIDQVMALLLSPLSLLTAVARSRRWPVAHLLFGKAFGDGLRDGVAIAWQNMPYIKGGWAQWHVVENAVHHFNKLDQGTGVTGLDSELSDPVFFIVGDQISSLPGWQEGAITSALMALGRMARPDLEIPYLKKLPDTRLMVEGI